MAAAADAESLEAALERRRESLNEARVPGYERRLVPGLHDVDARVEAARRAARGEARKVKATLKRQGATPEVGRTPRSFRVVHVKPPPAEDRGKQTWDEATRRINANEWERPGENKRAPSPRLSTLVYKWEAIRPSTAPEPGARTRRTTGTPYAAEPPVDLWSGRSTPRSDLGAVSPRPQLLSATAGSASPTASAKASGRSSARVVARRPRNALPAKAAHAIERAYEAHVMENLVTRARALEAAELETRRLKLEANEHKALEAARKAEQTLSIVEARALRNHVEGRTATWEFKPPSASQGPFSNAPPPANPAMPDAPAVSGGGEYVDALAAEAARSAANAAAEAATESLMAMLSERAREARDAGGWLPGDILALPATYALSPTPLHDCKDGEQSPRKQDALMSKEKASAAAERATADAVRLALARAYADGEARGRRMCRDDIAARVSKFYLETRDREDLEPGELDSSLLIVDARENLVSEYAHLNDDERASVLSSGAGGVTDDLREAILRDMAPRRRAKVLSMLDKSALMNVAKHVNGSEMHEWLAGAATEAKMVFLTVATHDSRLRYLASEGGHDPTCAQAVMSLPKDLRRETFDRFPAFAALVKPSVASLSRGVTRQLISIGTTKHSSSVDAVLALVPEKYKDTLGTVDWIARLLKQVSVSAIAEALNDMDTPIHVGFLLRCLEIDPAIDVIREMEPRKAGRALMCALYPNAEHDDFLCHRESRLNTEGVAHPQSDENGGPEAGRASPNFSASSKMKEAARIALLVGHMKEFTTALLTRLENDPLIPRLVHAVDSHVSAVIIGLLPTEQRVTILEGLASLDVQSESLDREYHSAEAKMQCLTIISALGQGKSTVLRALSHKCLGECFDAAVSRHRWNITDSTAGHIGLTQVAQELVKSCMEPAMAAAALEYASVRTAAEILQRVGLKFGADVLSVMSPARRSADILAVWISEDSWERTDMVLKTMRLIEPSIGARILTVSKPLVTGQLLAGLCWLESPLATSACKLIMELSVPIVANAIMALKMQSNMANVLVCVPHAHAARILAELDPVRCSRVLDFMTNEQLKMLDHSPDTTQLGLMFRNANMGTVKICLGLMEDMWVAGSAIEAMIAHGIALPVPDAADDEFKMDIPQSLELAVDVLQRLFSVRAGQVLANFTGDVPRALVIRLIGDQHAAGVLAKIIAHPNRIVDALKLLPFAFMMKVREAIPKTCPVSIELEKYLLIRFETQTLVNRVYKDLQLLVREAEEYTSGFPWSDAQTYYTLAMDARRKMRRIVKRYSRFAPTAARNIASGGLSARGVGVLVALLALVGDVHANDLVKRELAIRSPDEEDRYAINLKADDYSNVEMRYHLAYRLVVRVSGEGVVTEPSGSKLDSALFEFEKSVRLGKGEEYTEATVMGLTSVLEEISGPLCDEFPSEQAERDGMEALLLRYKRVAHYLCILAEPLGEEYETLALEEPEEARATYAMLGALGLAHCVTCAAFHAQFVAKTRGDGTNVVAKRHRKISEDDDGEALSDQSLFIFDAAMSHSRVDGRAPVDRPS